MPNSNSSLGIIDIGSNTLLMTCGRLNSLRQLEVILEAHEVARLGEGLVEGGRLLPSARQRVLTGLRDFQQQAQRAGIGKILAFGTAAFRRAQDGQEFAEQIERELKIPTQILSGEQEAFYSFYSAEKDFGDSEHLGMIDIGGGSTELVFRSSKNAISLPLGTVRLAESLVSAHPISDANWVRLGQEIRQILEKNLKNTSSTFSFSSKDASSSKWAAVAATPTSLAAVIQQLEVFAPEKVHGFVLERPVLEACIEQLRKLSIPERQKLKGMDVKRAELLPLGGLILLEIVDFLGISQVIVSHHGLRYGILWERLS